MRYLLLFILFSCSVTKKKNQYSDKSIKPSEAPAFLLKATPRGPDIEDVEYFVKTSPDAITYEVKYEKNDQEVSLTFSEQGEFLEKEEDKKFSSLSSDVKNKIKSHLKKRFQRYSIHETEIRTTKNGNQLIDVEVSHNEEPSGLSELSYTLEGEFVSEEVEDMPLIETLN